MGEIRVTHEQNLVLPHVQQARPAGDLRAAEGAGPGHAQCRPDHRHHRLPGPGLLRPGQCALDSDRAGHRQALRRPRPPARDRRAQDQDLRLHQCLRPSSCRPHRHPGRRQEGRGILPAPARRLGRGRRQHRRHHGPGLRRARDRPARSSAWSMPISSCARTANASSTPIAASAWSRSRTWPIWSSSMPLIKRRHESGASPPIRSRASPTTRRCRTDGGAIVSLARFRKDRDALLARNAPIGVQLQVRRVARSSWATTCIACRWW